MACRTAVGIALSGPHSIPDNILQSFFCFHHYAQPRKELRLQLSFLDSFRLEIYPYVSVRIYRISVFAVKSPWLVQTAEIFLDHDRDLILFFLIPEIYSLFASQLDEIFVQPILFFIHIIVNSSPVNRHLRASGKICFSVFFYRHKPAEDFVKSCFDFFILNIKDPFFLPDPQRAFLCPYRQLFSPDI